MKARSLQGFPLGPEDLGMTAKENPAFLNVLVVDDESVLRAAVARALVNSGFNVFQAHSGNSALEITENERIDIVVSDVQMAEGDGIFLLEKLREKNQTLPVFVFMTGYSGLSAESMIKKGCRAVIKKPFPRALLLQILNEIAHADFKDRVL